MPHNELARLREILARIEGIVSPNGLDQWTYIGAVFEIRRLIAVANLSPVPDTHKDGAA